jgi:hypothetical protein
LLQGDPFPALSFQGGNGRIAVKLASHDDAASVSAALQDNGMSGEHFGRSILKIESCLETQIVERVIRVNVAATWFVHG